MLETQGVEQGSQQEAFWVAGDQTTSLIPLLRGKPQPSSACGFSYRFTSVLGVWGVSLASEVSNPSNCMSKEFWALVMCYWQLSYQQEVTKSFCFSRSPFRWKRTPDGTLVERFDKRVLEFVALQRRDTLEWALPEVCCWKRVLYRHCKSDYVMWLVPLLIGC